MLYDLYIKILNRKYKNLGNQNLVKFLIDL